VANPASLRCERCGAPALELLLVALPAPRQPGARSLGGPESTPPRVARCCPACALELALEGLAPPRSQGAWERVEAAYDPDRAAALAAAAEEIDPCLSGLVAQVVRCGSAPRVAVYALHVALDDLLSFLTQYGSHAHCRSAGQAISRAGAHTGAWVNVPPVYGELLRAMGGPMQNAAWDGPLATQLRTTPGQLLAVLRDLR
jgi:hypothetical protein